jgi:hypothetical protein
LLLSLVWSSSVTPAYAARSFFDECLVTSLEEQLTPQTPFAALSAKYSGYSPTSVADNLQFESITLHNPAAARLYSESELAILKDLNEKIIGDKNLVTALTNLYKKILFTTLTDPSYAPLRNELVAKYSDYKSVRLAFKHRTPELEKLVTQLHESAGKIFKRELDRNGVQAYFGHKHPAVRMPENWHLSGLGGSVDEAGFAARMNRKNAYEGFQVPTQSFAKVRQTVQDDLDEWKDLQTILKEHRSRSKWVDAGMLELQNGNPILTTDFIDTIKKTNPKYLGSTIQKKFGVATDDTERLILIRLLEKTNSSFSAGIFQAHRLELHSLPAEHGVISIDFAGQGAKNTNEVMRQLSDPRIKTVDQSLRATRRAERVSTRLFDAQKIYLRSVVDQLTSRGIMPKGTLVFFSGDDGLIVLGGKLKNPETTVRELLKALDQAPSLIASEKAPRLVYAPEKATTPSEVSTRGRRIIQAEGLEKKLRAEIFEQRTDQVDRREINRTVFLLDLQSETPKLEIGAINRDAIPAIRKAFETLTH